MGKGNVQVAQNTKMVHYFVPPRGYAYLQEEIVSWRCVFVDAEWAVVFCLAEYVVLVVQKEVLCFHGRQARHTKNDNNEENSGEEPGPMKGGGGHHTTWRRNEKGNATNRSQPGVGVAQTGTHRTKRPPNGGGSVWSNLHRLIHTPDFGITMDTIGD